MKPLVVATVGSVSLVAFWVLYALALPPPPPAPTAPGPPPTCANWKMPVGAIPHDVVVRAYQLLRLPNGSVNVEWWDGQWWRFLREVHPPDKGIPFSHPGTTVFTCQS
jgi:hypothetical protein